MEEQETFLDPMEDIEPAAQPEESATSEPEAEPTAQEATPEPDKKKDGVQEAIDRLTFKRREAERERDYWREQAMRQAQPQQQESQPQQSQPQGYPDLPEPKSEQFDTYDAFVAEHSKWAAKVTLQQFQQQQREQYQQQAKRSWNDQGRSKYADWDEALPREGVPITEAMGQAIMDSTLGHDLAYYLGKNRDEAYRIATLPAHRQIYELGKLEAKLVGPPQKSKSSAPTPTSPVGGKEVPSKKLEDMSDEEYTAIRERQLGYK